MIYYQWSELQVLWFCQGSSQKGDGSLFYNALAEAIDIRDPINIDPFTSGLPIDLTIPSPEEIIGFIYQLAIPCIDLHIECSNRSADRSPVAPA